MIGRYPVTDDTAGNLSCSHSPFGPVYESPTTRQTGLLPCRQSAQNPTGTSPIAVYGPRPPDFECPLQELRATRKQDGQSQPKFGLRLCHSVACS